MIERVEELRREGEAAIGAAGSSDDLEALRGRYLGRKAELPNLLRGVASLPPEERGPAGRAANEARKALEAGLPAPPTGHEPGGAEPGPAPPRAAPASRSSSGRSSTLRSPPTAST